MANLKGFGRKLTVTWKDSEKPRKTSVRIYDVSAEIRTEYSPNANLEACL
jgi:hypothetical protein